MASAPPPRPASAAGLRVLLVATTEDHANRFAAHVLVEAVHAVGQALARVHLQHVRALDLAVLAHERGPEVVFVPGGRTWKAGQSLKESALQSSEFVRTDRSGEMFINTFEGDLLTCP